MKYLALALAATLGVQPALATETVTYTYDALGRVKKVEHVGGDNDGMKQTFTLDPAGNRENYTVTGSKNRGAIRVIVLPLNGFTIIPINQN
jgi:hypothetical protein